MRQLLILASCLTVFGCSENASESDVIPDEIRVAVLPDQAPENLRARHEPLLDYLHAYTGIRFELVLPADYEDLLRLFDSGAVELAWFGGLTFVRAEQQAHAVPLVLRDIDIQFTSCYLTRASAARSSFTAFEGESFGFGPRLSTSGHLMPRYFMAEQGVVPEVFFSSVQHSSGHDQTAGWVADGTVTLGVANCVIVQSLLADGRIRDGQIRIIETTPPYADYVWAAQTSMSEATRTRIIDAFLALDATNTEHLDVLQRQGANAYLPAGSEDFASVRAAAVQAGLLRIEKVP